MKKTKNITIIIAIVIATCIVYTVTFDLNQENRLNKEVDNYLKNGTINAAIKTKNEYAKVEKLIKNDFKNFDTAANSLLEIYQNHSIVELLSAKNMEDDGPKFIETKNTIHTMKKDLDNNIDILKSIIDINEFEKRANKEKLNKYYFDLYKDYHEKSEFESSIDLIIDENIKVYLKLDYLEQTINYLTKNNQLWSIKNNQLISTNDKFIAEYNDLLKSINNI